MNDHCRLLFVFDSSALYIVYFLGLSGNKNVEQLVIEMKKISRRMKRKHFFPRSHIKWNPAVRKTMMIMTSVLSFR